MKKHLIIHGDPCSGKTLFIKNLLRHRKHFRIDARNKSVFESTFYWNMSSHYKDVKFLWFEDIKNDENIDLFISLTEIIKINPKNEIPFYIKPNVVLEFANQIERFPASIKHRFEIINTNTISYAKLIEFIKQWNKL